MLYYRHFIPKFAQLAKPLMDLSTLHPSQFKWENVHHKAFDSMIDAIQNNTSLNLPDPLKPFFAQTDASDVARARRVFQKDDQGNELLMVCVSRTFTSAKRKYGTFRKEVSSLLYCLKSMDWERGELPIILVHKKQQRARKSLKARKIDFIVLG
jgi:hypothetical protein